MMKSLESIFSKTIIRITIPFIVLMLLAGFVRNQYLERIFLTSLEKNNTEYIHEKSTGLYNLLKSCHENCESQSQAIETLQYATQSDHKTVSFIIQQRETTALGGDTPITYHELLNQKENYLLSEKLFKPWDIKLIVAIPKSHGSDILAKYTQSLFFTTLMIIVLFTVILYFLFYYLINKNINVTLSKLEEIQKGDFDKIAPTPKSNEFMKLDSGINHMIDVLHDRETSLIQQKNHISHILDSQPTIVLITDGYLIQEANSEFFKFFDQYTDIDHFRSEHNCICEFFEQRKGSNYIVNDLDRNWIDKVLDKTHHDAQALITKEEEEYIFSLKVNKISEEENIYYIVVLTDISDLIKSKEKLDYQLHVDGLTHLPNRRSLFEDIKDNSILYLLNIDGFKEINDYYGFSIGDDVLLQLSKKLACIIPNEYYALYKLTADEFAIMYTPSEPIDANSIDIIYNNVISSFATQYIETKAYDFNISLTIGTSSTIYVPNKDLISSADIALKTAKKEKKTYMKYTDTLYVKEEYKEHIKWTKILNFAIDNDDIIPYFQPIVDTQSGEVIKYETLVRLRFGDEIVSPFYFLDIAKVNKLYTKLTKIVFDGAHDAYQSSNIPLNVNLSIEDILDLDTNNYILQKLDQDRDFAHNLTFELVESEGIENFEEVNAFIQEVKKRGCKIAIDDFGSGYSNFEYILKLDTDYIKIDGSLIKNIHSDKNSRILATNITNVARDLGKKTIAEFVHSRDVHDTIKELQIDYAQGYFFGEPRETI
jgi:diguanylate cyclase (GGDEF)-like protein